MSEEKIMELLKKENLNDIDKELIKIYPNGFDIDKIDPRIKHKIIELKNKYDSIQNPIQLRKAPIK